MARSSLLIFFILLEIFQVVYCVSENDSFDPFSPKISKKSDLKATNLSDDKGLLFHNNEEPLDEKIIEKRRLFFNEGEVKPGMHSEQETEVDDFSSRRRTNFSEIETEEQISNQQEAYNNWDNRQNRFLLPLISSRNTAEFRSRQPWIGPRSNQNTNWEQRSDVFDSEKVKTHSRWNEDTSFRQLENPEFHSRQANSYNRRLSEMYHDNDMNFNVKPSRNGDVFNKRVSITTLDEPKDYKEDKVEEMNPAYIGTANMNYYNRNAKSFWNPNFYRPEKGVIINFNTECPAPRQFNNQLVHKFIYTQNPQLNSAPEITSFQVPESAIISSQKMTPMYYL